VIISAKITSDEIIVSVKDTGVGIPESELGKLFRIETKYSVPGTENEQGTGLGLKLSKEFAEKLGGRIWVKSIEHKGSEFKFSIPLIKA
jgi:signal transduction histidine kinase